MGEPATRELDYREYLALCEAEDGLFEFHDGRVVAMVAPTPEHARLVGRLVELLRARLSDRECTALPSGLKVRIEATNRTLVPDVTVVCGPLERSETDPQAAVNAKVVFEVLSPSTEAYDQGPKFHQYRRLDALEEYVVVAQDRRLVSVSRRVGDLWSFVDRAGGERVELRSLGVELSVDELYQDGLGVIA